MFKKFRNKSGVSKNVLTMGLVSLFNDISSEMIYPIIPIFLTSVLGAPIPIIGLIEGIAESTASLLRVVSGWWSDKIKKRKVFVVFGYSLSAISKALIGLASTWHLVLFARFADRFGKGTRTTARDALILESVEYRNRGKAFGLHRAMDTAGAVLGPIIALLLVYYLDNKYSTIFFIAFIPSCIGVFLLIFFVKEKKKDFNKNEIIVSGQVPKKEFKFKLSELDYNFKTFLSASIIFAIGNSSDAFLILQAKNLGLSNTQTVMTYVLFNLTYSFLSYPFGVMSDKKGPRKILISGFWLFAFIYLMFGLINTPSFVWFLFPLYGIYKAMTEGVSRVYIMQAIPDERSGTAFGIYDTAIGFMTFFASLIAGLLWKYINPSAPFIFGGVMAIIAALVFMFFRPKTKAVN